MQKPYPPVPVNGAFWGHRVFADGIKLRHCRKVGPDPYEWHPFKRGEIGTQMYREGKSLQRHRGRPAV